MKHLIALIASMFGYYVIIRFTQLMYFQGKKLGYFGTAQALIEKNEPFFYVLLLIKWRIKPRHF
jgi:hypothetical protein